MGEDYNSNNWFDFGAYDFEARGAYTRALDVLSDYILNTVVTSFKIEQDILLIYVEEVYGLSIEDWDLSNSLKQGG